MNDFREFSEKYNDYLMHKQYVKKKSSKSIPKEYATNPAGYVQFLRNHEHMTDDEIKDHIDYRIRYEGGSTMEFFYKCLAYLDNSNLKHGINDFRDVHEDYLMHFGILGMKWGVRRYQNPDGTLTDAGKKRYDRKMSKVKMYEDAKNTAASGYKYYNMPTTAKISGNYLDEQIKRARKDAEKYGTETREDREKRIQKEYDQKKTVAEKYGFKGDNDMDGDFVNNKKDIVIDKDTIMSDKFMKQVGDFNKNYKDHDAIMRNAAVKEMAERLNVSESQMKKNIDKYGRPFIYMTDGKDGGISMTADYDIGDGNHVATVEYDPKTKKVYNVSMNG